MSSAELRQRQVQKPDTKESINGHPPRWKEHSGGQQALRAVLFALYFLSCCSMIFCTQLMGALLYFFDKPRFYRYMAWTKEQFALVLVFSTDLWSPTTVRVYADKSVKGEISMKNGRLATRFADRMVMIANHQIYTDWIYLWWIAYANRLHGHFYIMLKRSLQFIPIIGWGMQFFGFVFMDRKWASDEARIRHRLEKLNTPLAPSEKPEPMWFLLFPEGTNLSINGRNKSKQWAEKSGEIDMTHQMLPRSKGLLFTLRQLQRSVDWVYDCTMGYEGVPPGEYGQDIFTLRSTYFAGHPPRSVSLHWRRFPISSIPLSPLPTDGTGPEADAKVEQRFHNWLLDRWREKDALLDRYMKHGSFDAHDSGDIQRFLANHPPQYKDGYYFDFPAADMESVETGVRPVTAYEFLQIIIAPVVVGLGVGQISVWLGKLFWW